MSRSANKKSWKYGQWSIVCGAAEGIGGAFSECLAKRGINLVMVDNNEKELSKHSNILKEKYQIQSIKICLNLNDAQSYKKIITSIQNLDCGLLIYVAAYSYINTFVNYSAEQLDSFININIRTQTFLIQKFAKKLKENNQKGGIIIISSLAGKFGTHLVTPYSASKAYGIMLAEALNYELKNHGIDVMACIAGATDTPAFRRSNPNKRGIPLMKPKEVAESAIPKLGKKTLFIPGWKNRLNYFFLTKILPRRISVKVINDAIGRMYCDRS